MEGLIINLMEACEQALAEPTNYPSRANLMWCATMALNGWTAAGLGKTAFPMHMIEHAMSALYDVPHGAGLSVVMPAWMGWAAERRPQKFAQLATRVFGIQQGGEDERALNGINRLRAWFAQVGSPTTLEAIGIPATAIPALATNSLTQAKLWRLEGYDQQTVEGILKRAV